MNTNTENKIERVNSRTQEFASYIARCDVQSFMGVCKILNIKMDNGAKTKEEFDLRPFEEVWAEMIEKFNNLGRAQRRDLNKIIKAVAPHGDN